MGLAIKLSVKRSVRANLENYESQVTACCKLQCWAMMMMNTHPTETLPTDSCYSGYT